MKNMVKLTDQAPLDCICRSCGTKRELDGGLSVRTGAELRILLPCYTCKGRKMWHNYQPSTATL